MDRIEALELLYRSLPQTFKDAALRERINGYPWLPEEQAELGKCLRRLKRLDTEDTVPYTEVMEAMKAICGYNYRVIGDGIKVKIRGLWGKGFKLADFEKVFKRKTKEWRGTSMEIYLRPATLFDHFEDYWGAPDSAVLPAGSVHRAQSAPDNCPCEGANIAAAKKAARGVSNA